jgi:hypothetical protein
MRPMDAQNRLPEVATDQFALDRTLKHLRKLRWIGRESEAEKILAVLDVRMAGTRTEPPVSVPSAKSVWPATTATADPLDEPPSRRSGQIGLIRSGNGRCCLPD